MSPPSGHKENGTDKASGREKGPKHKADTVPQRSVDTSNLSD